MREVRADRGDDDAGFHGDELDSDQRHADPGVDHDAFVEYAVENVDDAGAARLAVNAQTRTTSADHDAYTLSSQPMAHTPTLAGIVFVPAGNGLRCDCHD